jgi:alpha-tubulin suppressor-like RCC1 family protein
VPEPVSIPGVVVSVSAGGSGQSCAATVDGAVWCWGLTEPPTRVEGVQATQVSVGLVHACGAGPQGTFCWGNNANGQLGTGSTSSVQGAFRVPVDGIATVSAGDLHTCASKRDGTMVCWGSNDVGQLGSLPMGGTAIAPRPVMWVQDAVQVSAGGFHTCARRADNGVVCWGDNLHGQLGDGTRARSVTLVVPRSVDGIVSLSAGAGHTCGARSDGQLLCWGASESGQIGSDDDADQLVPGRVRNIDDARAVSAGQQHTCVVRDSGLHCVGGNIASQLGDGGRVSRHTLAPVAQPKTGETPK